MQDIPSLPICRSSTKYHKTPIFHIPNSHEISSQSQEKVWAYFFSNILLTWNDWRLEWFWKAVCLKPLNPQTWASEPTFSIGPWWPQMTLFDGKNLNSTFKLKSPFFKEKKTIFIDPAIHFLGYRRKKV